MLLHFDLLTTLTRSNDIPSKRHIGHGAIASKFLRISTDVTEYFQLILVMGSTTWLDHHLSFIVVTRFLFITITKNYAHNLGHQIYFHVILCISFTFRYHLIYMWLLSWSHSFFSWCEVDVNSFYNFSDIVIKRCCAFMYTILLNRFDNIGLKVMHTILYGEDMIRLKAHYNWHCISFDSLTW